MNAKHLRIGNYLERYNKVTGLKDIIEVGGDTPFLAFESMTTLQFNPIPLTEEWLFRFGFVDFERGSFSYYIENNGEIVFKKSGLDILYDYPIQYIHQLQNLFFSLCGEELQLK